MRHAAAMPVQSIIDIGSNYLSELTVDPKTKPVQLYTSRIGSYLSFVNLVAYPKGIRAYWDRSMHLKSGLSVLDAGCGTGIASLALRQAMIERGLGLERMSCFDITPRMLSAFRVKLQNDAIEEFEVVQGDVLHLDTLPADWKNFDLIISAAMMEYLPREHFAEALSGLRLRLNATGCMVLFITRKNWLMNLLIGKWWRANCYHKSELLDFFTQAGFSRVSFNSFPFPYNYLSVWGYIVEAE